MPKIELKRCPFCGGKPRIFRHSVKIPFTVWACECVSCGATPYLFAIENGHDMEYIEEVISRNWNRRVEN